MENNGTEADSTGGVLCDTCGSRYETPRGLSSHKTQAHSDGRHKDPDTLRTLYIDEGLTTTEIAKRLDCSEGIINKNLHKFEIPLRPPANVPQKEYPDELKDSLWLRKKFIGHGLSYSQIASDLGCTRGDVRRWAKKHGISYPGDPHERTPKGPDSHLWNGGSHEYGPSFTTALRNEIRRRDDLCCRDCGLSQSAHLQKHNERLHVHHITKAREFENHTQRNDETNLLSLCRECHYRWEKMYPLRPQI